jgi:perosamine synthetase
MTGYPVGRPDLSGKEEQYVLEALRENAISSLGRHVAEFERAFAAFHRVPSAVAVSNGTAALHLALHALGLGPGDEVIVPDLTFVATANAVAYTGATPVIVDVEPASWTIDVDQVARAITERTKAVVAVHLYGVPAQMRRLRDLVKGRSIAIVEDAAEALGAREDGRLVGTLGDAGCFSFYGNKIITTGEGGMVIASGGSMDHRLRHLRDHAMSAVERYHHDEIGFNYRLTAVQAAIGLAQVERLGSFLEERKKIEGWYRRELTGVRDVVFRNSPEGSDPVCWLFTCRIEGSTRERRDGIIARLRAEGVDSRPALRPMRSLPMYAGPSLPTAKRISDEGISLPTFVGLREPDVTAICGILRKLV